MEVDSWARRKSSGGRKAQRVFIWASEAEEMKGMVMSVFSRSGSVV